MCGLCCWDSLRGGRGARWRVRLGAPVASGDLPVGIVQSPSSVCEKQILGSLWGSWRCVAIAGEAQSAAAGGPGESRLRVSHGSHGSRVALQQTQPGSPTSTVTLGTHVLCELQRYFCFVFFRSRGVVGRWHELYPCCVGSTCGTTEAAMHVVCASAAAPPLLLLEAQRCTPVCSSDVPLWPPQHLLGLRQAMHV